MTDASFDYDVLVIGVGNAGSAAARAAAGEGSRVAAIDRRPDAVQIPPSPDVTAIVGSAMFLDGNTVLVTGGVGDRHQVVRATRIVVAVGREVPVGRGFGPAGGRTPRPGSDLVTTCRPEDVPDQVVIVGAGEEGIELASALSTLGAQVTLVDQELRLLPGWDRELVCELEYHFRARDVRLRLGQELVSLDHRGTQSFARLSNGQCLAADWVLLATGSDAATRNLGLRAVGVGLDARGRPRVDRSFRTNVGNVFAAGSVLGRPLQAASSTAQGRQAGLSAAGRPVDRDLAPEPVVLLTSPEIGCLGATEEDLVADGVAYETGRARLPGFGMLKVLVDATELEVVGVHVAGTGAARLLAHGQVLLGSEPALGQLLGAVTGQAELAPFLAAGHDVAARLALNSDALVA